MKNIIKLWKSINTIANTGYQTYGKKTEKKKKKERKKSFR